MSKNATATKVTSPSATRYMRLVDGSVVPKHAPGRLPKGAVMWDPAANKPLVETKKKTAKVIPIAKQGTKHPVLKKALTKKTPLAAEKIRWIETGLKNGFITVNIPGF